MIILFKHPFWPFQADMQLMYCMYMLGKRFFFFFYLCKGPAWCKRLRQVPRLRWIDDGGIELVPWGLRFAVVATGSGEVEGQSSAKSLMYTQTSTCHIQQAHIISHRKKRVCLRISVFFPSFSLSLHTSSHAKPNTLYAENGSFWGTDIPNYQFQNRCVAVVSTR